MTDVLVATEKSKDPRYVYFHSGSTATYRKVTTSGHSSVTTIPTIDISDIDNPDVSVREALANELYNACSLNGFFYLKGHGISEDLQGKTFEVLKSFFALNSESKMEAHVQKNPAIRGFEPLGETRLDPRTRTRADVKESFTMGDCPLEVEQSYTMKTGNQPPANLKNPQNIWPETSAPWFRPGLYEYYSQVLPLSLKLVRLLALALRVDEDKFMKDYFNFPITGMRALHYPEADELEDGENVGLGAHADFSYLTLVLQAPISSQSMISTANGQGLEVLTPGGCWIKVLPIQGTLVCNVGQYLERQTNGKFLAAVHRVLNTPGQERYSLPFFLTMDPDADVQVLHGDEEKKFDNFNVGEMYIRKVLPARKKHPTSVKYMGLPESEWRYDFLLK